MAQPRPQHTKESVLAALSQTGSMKEAAALLNVSRQTLYDYLRRYDIEVNRRFIPTG